MSPCRSSEGNNPQETAVVRRMFIDTNDTGSCSLKYFKLLGLVSLNFKAMGKDMENLIFQRLTLFYGLVYMHCFNGFLADGHFVLCIKLNCL